MWIKFVWIIFVCKATYKPGRRCTHFLTRNGKHRARELQKEHAKWKLEPRTANTCSTRGNENRVVANCKKSTRDEKQITRTANPMCKLSTRTAKCPGNSAHGKENRARKLQTENTNCNCKQSTQTANRSRELQTKHANSKQSTRTANSPRNRACKWKMTLLIYGPP